MNSLLQSNDLYVCESSALHAEASSRERQGQRVAEDGGATELLPHTRLSTRLQEVIKDWSKCKNAFYIDSSLNPRSLIENYVISIRFAHLYFDVWFPASEVVLREVLCAGAVHGTEAGEVEGALVRQLGVILLEADRHLDHLG